MNKIKLSVISSNNLSFDIKNNNKGELRNILNGLIKLSTQKIELKLSNSIMVLNQETVREIVETNLSWKSIKW